MRTAGSRPSGDRSRSGVLEAATRALVASPKASLSDVAQAIGIGRTTLHRMFPTRRDLLASIAYDAVEHLAVVYREAGLVDGASDEPHRVATDPFEAIQRLVELMIPLGPSLMFLIRAPELDGDDELSARIAELDQPLRHALRQARLHGHVDAGVPDWWATEMLFAGVYVAWEQIDAGRLAPRDAGKLVYRTWRGGIDPGSRQPPP